MKVLYIEENKELRESTKIILEHIFSNILVSNCGEVALNFFNTEKYIDLVITSISLSDIDGFTLVKKMRETNENLHAIFLSNDNFDGYIEKISQASKINTFMTKSYEAEILIKTMESVVNKIKTSKQILYENTLYLQYQSALNKSSIISRTDLEGTLTYVNDSYCKISGYSREELISQKINITRNTKDATLKKITQAIKNQVETSIYNILNISKQGIQYSTDLNIIPIYDNKNNVVEFLFVEHDITYLNKSIEETKHAKKVQERFLATMSHEIRTPLNGIIGFTKILQKKIMEETLKSYVDIISLSSSHLLELINNILDIAKVQSGEINIENIWFDYSLQFIELKNLYKAIAQEKDIVLNCNICTKNYYINIEENTQLYGDITKIKQILSNLISNAIKFTPIGGRVDINIEPIKKSKKSIKILFSVEDTGIGISKKNQKKIFQPFKQADLSTTREYGGTGLGLSISKEFTKLLNSKLQLNSEIGKGSKFYFTMEFPYRVSKEMKISYKEDYSNIQFKGRVLIAEDIIINQKLMCEILSSYGIDSIFADNGKEAVEMFLKHSSKFDILFIDINMPVMNGIEACKEILKIQKNNHLNIPIVALTANAIKGDREKFLEVGFDYYISKPINNQELCAILINCLEHSNTSIQQNTYVKNKNQKSQINHINKNDLYKKNAAELQIPEEIYKNLLFEFLEKLDKEIQVLKFHILNENTEEVSEVVHRLKGTAGNLKLEAIYKILKEIDEIKFEKNLFLKSIDQIIQIKSLFN